MYKKYPDVPKGIGKVVRRGDEYWYLIAIENNSFSWLRVVKNEDGSFTGTNPNEIMKTTVMLSDKD